MKAILFHKYGPPDVLKLEEVPKPRPKDNEVLIKIHAATVTAGDCELRRFDLALWIWLPVRLMMGVIRPRVKILGQELAGVITAIGKNVTRFKIGDEIFGPAGPRFGAYAEYICLPEKHPMVHKPKNITLMEAATIPTGGLNALHFINKLKIKKGDKILINGAGGSIGTSSVQIVKYYGAEVTVVDSAKKLDMLKSIGADHTINYQDEDFRKSGQTFDAILDIVGNGWMTGVKALTNKGRYLVANPDSISILQALWMKLFSKRKLMNSLAPYSLQNLEFLQKLIQLGHIRQVIDRQYSMEEIVKAHRYVETSKKIGNVVIVINE